MSSSPQRDARHAGRGFTFALISVALFAVSPSLARLSYEAGAGPLTANVIRGCLMAGLFAIILLRAPASATPAVAPACKWLTGAMLGLSYAAFAWVYQMTIIEVGAGPALVAANASAILVVLWQARPIGARRSRHPAGAPELVAALVTVAGVCLLVGDANASLRGLIYCVLVMLSCGAMTIATERAADSGMNVAQRGRAIGLGMMMLLLPLMLGPPESTDGATLWVLALPEGMLGWVAFLGSAAAMIGAISLYSAAIGEIGAVRVSLIANAEPALGLLIAWIVAGEVLGPLGILGGVLASAGLVDWRKAMELAARRPRLGDT